MFELLSLALLGWFQATSPATAEPQEDFAISTIWTRPDTCNLALATRVDLQVLLEDPQKWTGKCVAVDGYWQSRALFATVRDTRTRYAQSADTLKLRRIGIYGTDELLSSAPRNPAAYTAVGLVGLCETLAQGAMMVFGYCHYTNGPYIAVAEMRRR